MPMDPSRAEPLPGRSPGERPLVGISSCLLGERVRWDGRDKRADALMALSSRVRWLPVCPEVEVGLGVPREPIRLQQGLDGLRLVGVESGSDHTAAMSAWARRRLASFPEVPSGWILKADSPSCGLGDVPVHDAEGRVVGRGVGRFAAALRGAFPDLPVADERDLATASRREAFLAAVSAAGAAGSAGTGG